MKLHSNSAKERHSINAYGEGFIEIEGAKYTQNLLVTASKIQTWPVANFAELAESDFADLLSLEPEVVLLATGKATRLPMPYLLKSLIALQIGVEAMDLGAACRTFNVLIAEGRSVLLAIVHDQ